MKLDVSESVAAALSGGVELVALIHGQGSGRWMRSIDDKNDTEPMQVDGLNQIRRFNVHFNIERDPGQKIIVMMDVQNIVTISGDESWIPIYGIVYFYRNEEKCSAVHCIFRLDGTMTLCPGLDKYPYATVSFE